MPLEEEEEEEEEKKKKKKKEYGTAEFCAEATSNLNVKWEGVETGWSWLRIETGGGHL